MVAHYLAKDGAVAFFPVILLVLLFVSHSTRPASRRLGSLLFGVSPTDPLTLGGVALLIGIVAISTCYIPARHAMCVDPIVALRHE